MLISESDKSYFPKFSEFVLNELPKVKNDTKIWNALTDKSGLRRETTSEWVFSLGRIQIPKGLGDKLTLPRLSLIDGLPPLLVPKDLGHNDIDGEFRTSAPHHISVNSYWVNKFEKDFSMKRAQEFARAVVLHELVHFPDFTDGIFNDCHRDNLNDSGFLFEDEAFGTRAKKWWESPHHTGGDSEDGNSWFDSWLEW